jgi:hypothetical protein
MRTCIAHYSNVRSGNKTNGRCIATSNKKYGRRMSHAARGILFTGRNCLMTYLVRLLNFHLDRSADQIAPNIEKVGKLKHCFSSKVVKHISCIKFAT